MINMLKRLFPVILVLSAFALASVPAAAQMSDDAVVEYVKDGIANGKSQNEMAMELAEINPESIPVNILTPIPNTPFESYIDKIDEENVLRTLAVFKIACPNSSIRLAGGKKSRLSLESIEKAFECLSRVIEE